ncbi:MAG: hypothetical protein PHG85_05790 [Candidatus Altiarchaeota archaeon]|nr:hypothetical protein [Candidatus Altiarchaeota archaeon]
MTANSKILALSMACLLLISGGVSAKRILFYEVGSGGDYMIEGGYSKFKQELQSRGHDVASITQAGSLTKDKLQGYDVLIIQDLRTQFTIEDISSILWFVMQKGSGLFINGGDPNSANKLTIPFGTTMDTAILKDITTPIPGDTNNYDFLVNNFPAEDEFRVLHQGVIKIGFYQGSGIFLSGNARCISSGDGDTFSETGSFASGSRPCISSAALFGNGLVFVHTDPDFLTDRNIGNFDNKAFGMDIIDWLSMSREMTPPGNTTQEIAVIIGSLNLENKRLEAQVDQLSKEKSYLETTLNDITNQLTDATDKILKMESERIGPLTKTNWTILIFGLCILGAAFMLSKRKEKKIHEEASELGYELGEELGDLSEESSGGPIGGGAGQPPKA